MYMYAWEDKEERKEGEREREGWNKNDKSVGDQYRRINISE